MSSGAVALGLVNGLIIGFLAVGLVLVYRANGFLNLAHAQFGVVSSLLLSKMVLDWHFNWWVAFVLSIPVGSLEAVLVYRVIVRRLQARTKSTVVLLLASIGVTNFLLMFDYIPSVGPSTAHFYKAGGFPLPFNAHIRIGNVTLLGDSLLTVILIPVLVLGLAFVLRYTTLGRMIRAAAANRNEARLCGVSVNRVSTMVWAGAGAMSAITAILAARGEGAGVASAVTGASQGFGPELLLLALGAAALGGFRSIPLALVGGVGLGVAQELTLTESGSAGTASVVVFVLILIVVLLRSRAIASAFGGSTTVLEDLPPMKIPERIATMTVVRYRSVMLAGFAVFVAVIAPFVPGIHSVGHRFLLVMILVFALMSISLTILISWGGQVSLGHMAVLGVGSYMAARLCNHETSLVVMLLVGGVVAALVTVIIGIPALRIRGLTLAVTTLGLAVVAPQWLYTQKWFAATSETNLVINQSPRIAVGLPRPQSMLTIYFVTIGLIVLVVGAVNGFRRSRAGRILIAVRDNERSAASFGISPESAKLTALALSGFIAGLAGVIFALANQNVTTSQFSPDLSLSLLAVPVIGGLGSISGSLLGAVALYVPIYFLAPELTSIFGSDGAETGLQLLLTGIGLPFILIAYPNGLAAAARRGFERFFERMAEVRTPTPELVAAEPLEVEDATISFGGIKALNGAAITVRQGEIVGLIGPNGAGKSTLINVISGVLKPSAGSVRVSGHEMVRLPPNYRAAYGVGRTFQDARIFPGLTVTEAVQVALGRTHRVGMLSPLVWAPWYRASERRSRDQALEILARFGLTAWKDTLTSDLSTGSRRICDLALQVAAGSKIVLLDEPTAGVAQREAEHFGPLLRRIRDELDCSVLIVEHDMPLLMGLCDRVYAMESGRVIAEGTPDEIRSDPNVIASYLGTDETAINRSGKSNDATVEIDVVHVNGSTNGKTPAASTRTPRARNSQPKVATKSAGTPARARTTRSTRTVTGSDTPERRSANGSEAKTAKAKQTTKSGATK